jgi:hypothetical protein
MRTAATLDAAVLQPSGAALHTLEMPDQGLALRVGGRFVGRVSIRPGPGWSEVVFRLPAASLGSGPVDLELAGRYAAFYYWFFQSP